MSREEVLTEAAGTGIGASLATTISLFTGRAAETLGLGSVSSVLHALIIGLYAVIFSGILYLVIKEKLRPKSPLLRLWLNTFLFCVFVILLDSQFSWFSRQVVKAVSSWPFTQGLYLSLETTTGALFYFLIPVAAAATESLVIFLRERESWEFPALKRIAHIFSES